MAEYHDRWIACTPSEIPIRAYYFPWGTKRIAYSSLRRLQRVTISAMGGKLRIWGTANPRYWASFDPTRPSKQVGFVLDTGKPVRPFVTPEDPDAFETTVRGYADLGTPSGGPSTGPVL